jgi:hypothetical protein
MFGVTGLHFGQIKLNYEDNGKNWAYRLNYGFWIFNWLFGHIFGGIFFFGLVGWLGSLLSTGARFYSLIGLGIICLIGTLHQFKIVQFPMPQIKRQVSRLWLNNLHKNIVAFGYGLQLGSSVITRIKIATTYAVIGFAFCSGSLVLGAIIGILFGLSRAVLPIFVAPINSSPNQSLMFAIKFNSYDKKVQFINGIALFLSCVALSLSYLIPNIKMVIK